MKTSCLWGFSRVGRRAAFTGKILPHYFKGVPSIYKDPGNSICKHFSVLKVTDFEKGNSGNKDMESPPLLVKGSSLSKQG